MVMLTKNLRSPGALADILREVRAQKISDATWGTLQEKVLGFERGASGVLEKKYAAEDDPRLLRPPFSNNTVQYILHRHVVRVSQSFHNILRDAERLQRRVYVALASDTVKSSQSALFTEAIRREVLQLVKPRDTKYLPGCCCFSIGMKLLLFSKKCVRLSLMNGATCILEDITFAGREVASVGLQGYDQVAIPGALQRGYARVAIPGATIGNEAVASAGSGGYDRVAIPGASRNMPDGPVGAVAPSGLAEGGCRFLRTSPSHRQWFPRQLSLSSCYGQFLPGV